MNSLKVTFLFSIVVVAVWFARFSAYVQEPLIASAITIDLILTLPFAFWLFFRRSGLPGSIFPILISAGFVISMLILPADNRTLFNYLLFFGVPILELGSLAYAGSLIYRSRKTFASLEDDGHDFLEKLRQTLLSHFPTPFLAKAMAVEIAGAYYMLFKWKRSRGRDQFSYHKSNGVIALLLVFAFIVAAETVVFHFLLVKWSLTAAWIFSISSLYLIFQIISHLKAIILRPIEITEDRLFLRCGLMGDAEIELSDIERVSKSARQDNDKEISVRLLPLGDIIKGNVRITVKTENYLSGIYGRKKAFKHLDLFIDEAERFTAELDQKLDKENKEKK
ncbi:MAG: hypothetical protein KDB79_05760 [Acidobacteria bacterium]|nr:hypothetical protein [Acidobacteriota bacterium]